MAAGTRNLVLEQGASFRMSLTWAQKAEDEEGNVIAGEAYDLSNARGRMQIRTKARESGGELLVDLTTENGGIVFGTDGDATDGKIAVYISPEQTNSIHLKKTFYDLFVIFDGAIDATRLLQGQVATRFTYTNDGDGAPTDEDGEVGG